MGRDSVRGQKAWLHTVVLPLPLTSDCGLEQDAEPPWASAFSSVKWNQCREDCRRDRSRVQLQNHSIYSKEKLAEAMRGLQKPPGVHVEPSWVGSPRKTWQNRPTEGVHAPASIRRAETQRLPLELLASRAHSEGRDPGGKSPSPKDLKGIWPISRASPNRQSIIYRLGEAFLVPGVRQGEKEAGRRAGYEGLSPSPEHAPSVLCPVMPGWDSENHPSSLPAARGRRMGEAGCLSVRPAPAP